MHIHKCEVYTQPNIAPHERAPGGITHVKSWISFPHWLPWEHHLATLWWFPAKHQIWKTLSHLCQTKPTVTPTLTSWWIHSRWSCLWFFLQSCGGILCDTSHPPLPAHLPSTNERKTFTHGCHSLECTSFSLFPPGKMQLYYQMLGLELNILYILWQVLREGPTSLMFATLIRLRKPRIAKF